MPGALANFLNNVHEYKLLEPNQLEQIKRWPQAQGDDPAPLARELVKRGWLTGYQVNQIVKGNARDLVVGSYRILDRLGEGGMGQVFKADHQAMKRTVALKLIRKERLANPDAERRFFQEVQAAGKLHHPNIVTAYDAGKFGAGCFFAMEHVEGVDLSRLQKQQGKLTIGECCEYIRQAAVGLQYVHERGLVHRDIKPANLLVCRPPKGNPVVKILDMGLARFDQEDATALTRDGCVMGTPDYMAPEQAINSHQVDIRADLYSLGCTFYFLLTGQPPFKGGMLTELLLKHQNDEPTPVNKLRPEVPASVAEIVHKLLAKKPEDRYQTPIQLVQALVALKKKGSALKPLDATVAVPGLATPKKRRWLRRLVTALVLLVGLAGVGAGIWVSPYILPFLGQADNSPADLAKGKEPPDPPRTDGVTKTKDPIATPTPDPKEKDKPEPAKPEPKEKTKPEPTKPEPKEKDKPEPPKPEPGPKEKEKPEPTEKPKPEPEPKKPDPPKPEPEPAPKRAPVPAEEARKKAEQQIREVAFKAEYAKRQPADMIALANLLLKEASDPKRYPATERYVLCEEARQLAARAGDAETAVRAVDALAQEFEISAVPLKLATLQVTASSTKLTENRQAVINLAVGLAETEAVQTEDFEVADKLFQLAIDLAVKEKLPKTAVLTLNARRTDVKKIQEAFARAQQARAQLTMNPNDAEASYTLGWYLCCLKGEWSIKALDHLAKGKDEALQSLAKKDLSAPRNPSAQAALADEWWKLAESYQAKEPDKEKLAPDVLQMMKHAAEWYADALNGGLADGLDKKVAQGRLDWLAKQAPQHLQGPAPPKVFQHGAKVTAVLFDKSGQRFFSAGEDERVLDWHVSNVAKQFGQFKGLQAPPRSIALSPDGAYLAAAAPGEYDIWKVSNHAADARVTTKQAGASYSAIAFLDANRVLLGWTDGTLSFRAWKDDFASTRFLRSEATGQVIHTLLPRPQGKAYIATNAAIFLWDIDGDNQLPEFYPPPPVAKGAQIRAAAISRDGKLLAAGLSDGTVCLWTIGAKSPAPRTSPVKRGHSGPVNSVAFAPDGRIVSGGEDKSVRLWIPSPTVATALSELRQLKGHEGPVTSVAFSPDGKSVLSGSADKTVRLWEIAR